MPVQFDFCKMSIVVTGGARGIGFEVAKQFLQSGAQVAIWDYNTESLDAAKAELGTFSNQAKFIQADVTDMESCRTAAAATGPVDVLVNNAGITRDKSLAKMTADDFEAVVRTNLTGLFHVTKSFLDAGLFSANSRQNRIINMASVVALYGNFGQSNYAAAKAGVIGMTKTWAKELGRKGFTVNAVAPGFIQTPMTALMPADVLKSIADKVPVQRMGTVDDIAKACLFLASDSASYINGAVLSVDGGVTL